MFKISRKFKTFALVFLFASGFFYLSYSAKKSETPTWYQGAAYRLVAPLAKGLRGVSHLLTSFYSNYIGLRDARKENQKLQQEIIQLRSELLHLQEEKRSWGELSSLIETLNPVLHQGRAARVVGYDPSFTTRSITIDQGLESGVKEDQVVLGQGGVIGRVLKAGPSHSQVLLITDLHSNVDVIDQQTRARGTLVGMRKGVGLNRDRWLTKAEYILGQEEIHPGDLLLTSGQDGIFPEGLPVGAVSTVKKDENGLFWRAEVEPSVEMTKLEEVLVLRGTMDQ
jgi:rod shape-determining protein MreC